MSPSEAVEYRPTIRDLPASERPRERLRERGAAALSSGELLAIILRTGTPSENVLALAIRTLARFGGLTGLAKASFGELCSQRGLGEAKAAQVKAALSWAAACSPPSPRSERQCTRLRTWPIWSWPRWTCSIRSTCAYSF